MVSLELRAAGGGPPGDGRACDAVGTQLRQIVTHYGPNTFHYLPHKMAPRPRPPPPPPPPSSEPTFHWLRHGAYTGAAVATVVPPAVAVTTALPLPLTKMMVTKEWLALRLGVGAAPVRLGA